MKKINRRKRENLKLDDSHCVICGYYQKFSILDLNNEHANREGLNCAKCNSSWRDRAVVLNALVSLNLNPNSLIDQELDFSHPMLGIGDSFRVQAALSSRLNYVNTFVDKFPRIDIQNCLEITDRFELITCSDVLEHVMDLEKAVLGLSSLLKLNGKLVVSVPRPLEDKSIEHYPGISSYQVEAHRAISWTNEQNESFADPAPVFHGGDALTLEIRQVGIKSLIRLFEANGIAVKYNVVVDKAFGVPAIGESHGFFIGEKVSA